MKRAAGTLALLLVVGLVGVGLHAVTIGFGVGYEISGLILLSALTETRINEAIDLRAQLGFATTDIAGLMLVTVDLLSHWVVPPLDPFLGLGIGVALTPPPFSTGLTVEGVAGLRAAPTDIVRLFLQARYIVRRAGAGWNAGPVFEGGLLVEL